MGLKELFSAAGIFVGIVGTFPYIRDTLRGKTKPHLVTWLIWTLLVWTAFAGQLIGGAGAGAYVTGITAVMNTFILVLCLRLPKTNITRVDVAMLVAALLILPIWRLTDSPTVSIILASIIMLIGYIPTYRKSWGVPEYETISLFVLSAVKQALGILGLVTYSLLTVIFPATLFVANIGLVLVIVLRRRAVEQTQ